MSICSHYDTQVFSRTESVSGQFRAEPNFAYTDDCVCVYVWNDQADDDDEEEAEKDDGEEKTTKKAEAKSKVGAAKDLNLSRHCTHETWFEHWIDSSVNPGPPSSF